MSDDLGLRDISDTARWVAIYRAIESERPDALYRDPLARRLAGERGERIAETMTSSLVNRNAWSFVARMVPFDMSYRGSPVRNGSGRRRGRLRTRRSTSPHISSSGDSRAAA